VPVAGHEEVFAYLGRYTHRVAISDHRLVEITDDAVTFKTKEGRQITVTPEEFIRRFLLHVLPDGFHKIRHLGLYAAANVHSRLEQARALLPTRARPAAIPVIIADAGAHPVEVAVSRTCPCCEVGTLLRLPIPRQRPPPELMLRPRDTS
jgi:hypothetical protein